MGNCSTVQIEVNLPRTLSEDSTNEMTNSGHSHEIEKASTSKAGIVKLNDTLVSLSKEEALTANQGRELSERIEEVLSASKVGAINKTLDAALAVLATRYTSAYATYQTARDNVYKHPENALIYIVNDPQMSFNGLWTVMGGKLVKAPWDVLSSALTSESFEILQFIFQGAAGEQIEYEGKTYDTLATFTQTLEEGKNYIQDVLIDLAQSNNFTASYLLTASGEFQEEINKYIPKPFLSGYTYGLGERVVLDNREIVKSLVNGNVGNPNVDMTGWVSESTLRQELANPDMGAMMVGFTTLGQGASARTVEGKLQDTISFFDFIPPQYVDDITNGASSYDCTLDIQRAIDSAPEGARLSGGNGTFNLSSVTVSKNLTLDLRGTKIIVLQSEGSGILFENSVDFAEVVGGEIVYSGLRYYGTSSPSLPQWYNDQAKGPQKHGICSYSVDFRCTDVRVSGFSHSGIRATGNKYVYLTNCICTDNGYAGALIEGENTTVIGGNYDFNGGGNGNDGYGIAANVYLNHADKGKAVFLGVVANGNYTRGLDTHAGHNLKFIGCHTEDNGVEHPRWGNERSLSGLGIRVTRRSVKVIFSGNLAKNNTLAQFSASSGLSYFSVDELIFTSNVAEGAFPMHIRPHLTKTILISSNILSNPDGDGVFILPQSDSNGMIDSLCISDNTIDGRISITIPEGIPDGVFKASISNNTSDALFVNNLSSSGLVISALSNRFTSGNAEVHSPAKDGSLVTLESNIVENGTLQIEGGIRGSVYNNKITSGGISGAGIVDVVGNTISRATSYSIYNISASTPVNFVGNTVIGSEYSGPAIRFRDVPRAIVSNNRFLNNDLSVDTRDNYRVDPGLMFKPTGSYITNRVELNPNAGEYVIGHSTFDPSNFVGEFRRGDIVRNGQATSGSYTGWICTEGGSPGTWKGFGMIEDDTVVAASTSGTTAQRPTGVAVGFTYFDTTLGKPVYFKSTGVWVDATGVTV